MDVHSVTSPAHSQLFADDILLDTASRSVATLNQVLSVAVSNLADYLHGKGLVLNPDKTQVLAIEASRRSTLELNVKGEVYPKIKFSPVVVFGVLSRMVLVRGS